MKIIAYIVGAILIFFGVLFIWGSSVTGASQFFIGLVTVLIGLAIIFWVSRRAAAEAKNTQNVTLNIDLPGNVSMDTMKCKSCGGVLSSENISMVAGAPVVTCPYCKTTYQLTEIPKW
ncbi:MAG: hypothetical protein AB9891_20605 [Anaerolineaceae bacterium]